jgi:tetratricopeptide (TPR) repeat protein
MKNKFVIFINLILFTTALLAQDINNLNNKFRLAQSYEQSGNTEKAISIYKELMEAQPWNNQFLQSLNTLYLNQKDYQSSIELLESKIKQTPADLNSYGMLGSTYYIMGKNEKAFEVWDSALENNNNHVTSYRIIANYAIQNRAFEKAVDYLNRGKEESNDPKMFSYDLANIYSLTMNYNKAMEEYCRLLIVSPEQLEIVKRRITNFFSSDEFKEQAAEVVKEHSLNDGGIVFYDLLTAIYIQSKNFKDAFSTIKELDERKSDNGSSLYTFANTAFRESEFAIASDAFNLILTRYPNSVLTPRAKIGYAETLKSKLDKKYSAEEASWKPFSNTDTAGAYEYDTIIEAYHEIIKMYPNTETAAAANYAIGLIYKNKLNDLISAENIFKTLSQGSIVSQIRPPANEQLALISIQKGSLTEADEFFNTILSNERTDEDRITKVKFYKSKIALWQNNYKESLNRLNEITKDLSNDYANDAIELSLILGTLKTDSINLSIYSKADLLLEQNKFTEALAEFNKLAVNPNLILLNDLAKFRTAQIYLALNNLPLAIEILQEIADSEVKTAYSDKALYLQANTFLHGIKNIDKAKESFEKLLELFPNSLYFDKSRQIINGIITKEKRNI